MLGPALGDVAVGRGALVAIGAIIIIKRPIIINMAKRVIWPSVESGFRRPHRTNALMNSVATQRRHTACSRASVEVGKSVPVPVSYQVA